MTLLSPTSPRGQPTFAVATRFWAKLGCISFGGPAGQIAIMHRELVERRAWVSEDDFLHALNFCMLLPGPEAQQLATWIGWRLHGLRGGLAAGGLFFLPSFFVLTALSCAYVVWGHTPAVDGLLYGLRPAVLALIFMAAWRIGTKALKTWWHRSLAVVTLVLSWVGLPFPAIIGMAAVAGYLIRSEGRNAPSSSAPASWRTIRARGVRGALIFAGFWGALYMMSATALGRGRDIALFFTQAAFVTFGGAYAVLPYVFDASVRHYAWLQPAQVIDGLALGETTPGPLIMVVTFIGFLAGWGDPVAGHSLASGLIGAAIATAFTFLPSIALILTLAPLVERAQAVPAVRRSLAGITAAVVGVIVRLGLDLSAAVLVAPMRGSLNVFPCALMALSLIALARKVSTPAVIVAAALLGVLAKFLGH